RDDLLFRPGALVPARVRVVRAVVAERVSEGSGAELLVLLLARQLPPLDAHAALVVRVPVLAAVPFRPHAAVTVERVLARGLAPRTQDALRGSSAHEPCSASGLLGPEP